MIPPVKPFPGYKWRWATLTPTEGLNEPPIYLGVLRVLRDNQGRRVSSPEVAEGLARVQGEVAGRVATALNLDRPDRRNIFRNSGQYWKALGLLASTRGGIRLTAFGEAVAAGSITRDEFAATVIKTLELPNRTIQQPSDREEWERANLKIKPLELLLNVMRAIGERYGADQGYLTNNELIRVVIPLAGTRPPMQEYIESVFAYRQGLLNTATWPNCTPEDNDHRMAREFLLFLSHYGFCERVPGEQNDLDQFVLKPASVPDVASLIDFPALPGADLMNVAQEVRANHITAFVERQRVLRPILERPQQSQFRRAILGAFNYSCLLTGERIAETLEAAHIIPVEYRGADTIGNGLCLRSDIHNLFDCGHLRINPNGGISSSEVVKASRNYATLPERIALPAFISPDALEWRWNYQ